MPNSHRLATTLKRLEPFCEVTNYAYVKDTEGTAIDATTPLFIDSGRYLRVQTKKNVLSTLSSVRNSPEVASPNHVVPRIMPQKTPEAGRTKALDTITAGNANTETP